MSSKTSKKIIGITGLFGSGKTTAADFFRDNGYKVFVLSSFLEKEALKRKLPLTREVLQNIGNQMREKHGNGFLLKTALEQLKDEDKIVIDGLRNFGEVEELKKQNGILLAIIANRDVRFERLRKLKRREKLTEQLFQRLDLRDMGVNEKITGLQTAICIALADFYIDSNNTTEEFEEDLNKFLKKYGK